MSLTKEIAEQAGVEQMSVVTMMGFVVRYVEKHFDGLPETIDDVLPYVEAGVMEFMDQQRKMTNRTMTRKSEFCDLIFRVLGERARADFVF